MRILESYSPYFHYWGLVAPRTLTTACCCSAGISVSQQTRTFTNLNTVLLKQQGHSVPFLRHFFLEIPGFNGYHELESEKLNSVGLVSC